MYYDEFYRRYGDVIHESDKERYVRDGVYLIDEGIEVFDLTGQSVPRYLFGPNPGDRRENPKYGAQSRELIARLEEFMAKHDGWVYASAYETHYVFILSRMPTPINSLVVGHGFNYGSTNILLAPHEGRYLILAEND